MKFKTQFNSLEFVYAITLAKTRNYKCKKYKNKEENLTKN